LNGYEHAASSAFSEAGLAYGADASRYPQAAFHQLRAAI